MIIISLVFTTWPKAGFLVGNSIFVQKIKFINKEKRKNISIIK